MPPVIPAPMQTRPRVCNGTPKPVHLTPLLGVLELARLPQSLRPNYLH
jgi:hypothetical protein